MASFADRFRVRKPANALSEESRRRIHESALRVMERTGIRIHSKTARDDLRRAGAVVDEKSMVVKLPVDLTESLLKTVPSEIVLAGRTKEFDLPVNGTHHYYTTDGCGISVWENQSRTRRESVLDDVTRTAVIGDYLPYVSIYEPMVVAHDVPPEKHVILGMREAMLNTSKHIETESTTTPEEARMQVKMAAEVVGSQEELKKRHYISAMVCTVSPLILEGPATDAALVWAENHVPVHITGMAMMGLTGPVTVAADLVVNHAETLSLACAMQAHEPGSPVIYGSVLSSMHPRTGAYNAGSPEAIKLSLASTEMARHCNIPCSCGGIGSSLPVPGIEAAIENSLMAAACVVSGSEIMNGIGLLDGSTLLSYEQMLIDNEIAGLTINSFKEIEVTDETLLEDLIMKVGIGGTYLTEPETARRIRDFYLPMLYDLEGFDQWMSKGRMDTMKIALERARAILKDHHPERLDNDIAKRLEQIVKGT